MDSEGNQDTPSGQPRDGYRKTALFMPGTRTDDAGSASWPKLYDILDAVGVYNVRESVGRRVARDMAEKPWLVVDAKFEPGSSPSE